MTIPTAARGSAPTPGVTARERLLEAAVEAFAEKGFNATTTRDIASRAGMSPAAVYVHHDTKESLLFTVSVEGHRAALKVIRTAATIDGDHVDRLRHMVREFSTWHAVNSRVGRIVQYEFDALTPEHRAEIADHRRRIERVMQDVLTAGVAEGAFEVVDVPGTTRAILSLSIDLVRWFTPRGSHSADDIATLHADLAVRMTAPHSTAPHS
ncbi:TetR/AcrR family transcriptional regulator [Aeromicrobium sp.]|uniref:TetR/AcrR family transcriptional regulator n=1 Tax=Aeromicrobium sp. TaxID=1871063 RepID=UPI003D6A62CD